MFIGMLKMDSIVNDKLINKILFDLNDRFFD